MLATEREIPLNEYLLSHGPFPLPTQHILSIFKDVTHELLALHSRTLSHGNVSDGAIMIDWEGRARLLDGPGGSRPEDDVFALGRLVYRLATGKPYPVVGGLPYAVDKQCVRLANMLIEMRMTVGQALFHPLVQEGVHHPPAQPFFAH